MSDSHTTYNMSSIIARGVVQLAITDIVIAVLLFWPAGTLGWGRGWWFIAVFSIGVIIAIVWVTRLNPELFEARQGFKPGTRTWDIIVASALIVAIATILPVAGLDNRFGWAQLPDWLAVVGYVLFVAGFWVTGWAQAVNRHFEMGVRIQTDRGHKVIDTGPYALIRHPGYSGVVGLAIGAALALGSGVALIPAVVTIAILAYRTMREDATLKAELEGYAEFATRTRYRWIPGVW